LSARGEFTRIQTQEIEDGVKNGTKLLFNGGRMHGYTLGHPKDEDVPRRVPLRRRNRPLSPEMPQPRTETTRKFVL